LFETGKFTAEAQRMEIETGLLINFKQLIDGIQRLTL